MPENPTYRSLESLLAKKGGELVVDVVKNFDERKVCRGLQSLQYVILAVLMRFTAKTCTN